ncbi:hypothetical protein [Cyanobium sp. LEGE 06113]|uniref:hypothetical protein n=1 Tax=Cyanobium sp. LEGE 06113 TaxID=1297573 RepID=UPI0018811777|nr:hypothetical protein [Cyanobium sp. LEGE 06113]MBE9153950.1 hypothetical protein [Cyanobium sp. LEGE 06113]
MPEINSNPQLPAPRRSTGMNGRKVLIALVVGVVIGGAIGIFMESIVANTPSEIDSEQLHWLRRLLAAAGGLSGLAIESVRQLQTACTDPAYRNRRRLRR